MIHLINKIKDEIKKDPVGFIVKTILVIFCGGIIVHAIDLLVKFYEKI